MLTSIEATGQSREYPVSSVNLSILWGKEIGLTDPVQLPAAFRAKIGARRQGRTIALVLYEKLHCTL
jgi:hypothetical protein